MATLNLPVIVLVLLSVFVIYRIQPLSEGFVNYYKCPTLGVGQLNSKIFDSHGWQRSQSKNQTKKTPSPDLYIPCGYNNVERELSDLKPDNTSMQIYGVPGCDQIVSKNRLWELVVDYWGLSEAQKIMPTTYLLNSSSDRQRLRKYWARMAHQSPNGQGPILILKKNVQQKKGLLLTRSWSDIRFARFKGYVVAQQYQTNLYQIQGRKINLRVYLAIRCYQKKVQAFLYQNGKCIYTSKSQHTHDDLDFETNITSYNLDPKVYQTHPLDFRQLRVHLQNEGHDPQILFRRITTLMTRTVQAVRPKLCGNTNLHQNRCFQLFGADIIFTPTLVPYLLECNKGPSLKPRTSGDHTLKTEMLTSLYSKMGLDDEMAQKSNPDLWVTLEL